MDFVKQIWTEWNHVDELLLVKFSRFFFSLLTKFVILNDDLSWQFLFFLKKIINRYFYRCSVSLDVRFFSSSPNCRRYAMSLTESSTEVNVIISNMLFVSISVYNRENIGKSCSTQSKRIQTICKWMYCIIDSPKFVGEEMRTVSKKLWLWIERKRNIRSSFIGFTWLCSTASSVRWNRM